MTAALEGGEKSARPGRTLPPEKTRYPFYRRLGGPQGRSGWAENLVPPGIRSRTVQPVAQSLYRLSYPAHTNIHTHVYIYIYIYIYVCVCVCVCVCVYIYIAKCSYCTARSIQRQISPGFDTSSYHLHKKQILVRKPRDHHNRPPAVHPTSETLST